MTLRDDAQDVLTGWHSPDDEQERLRRAYVSLVASRDDALSRRCRPGHLTASGLIFSADHREVLLTLHRVIGRWLQTGGHCEPADTSLAGAALREAHEESGIGGLRIDPVPVLLSLHTVPSCGGTGPADHLDVQHVVVAPADAAITISEESQDLAWFAADSPPDGTDQSVRDLIAAASSRLRGSL